MISKRNLGNQNFSLKATKIATKRTKESTKIFKLLTFAAHPECQFGWEEKRVMDHNKGTKGGPRLAYAKKFTTIKIKHQRQN